MKFRCISLFSAVAACMLLPAGLSAQTVRETPKPLPEKFQLLLQRSISSRERLRSATSRIRTETPRPPRPPAAPILTGIVQADEGFVAFLEDQRTGRTSLARVGQQLAEGRVEAMTLTYLVLRPNDGGESRRIVMGNTLSGDSRPSYASSSSSSSYTPTAVAGTQPATSGGGASSGLEEPGDPAERLRRRRLAELGISSGSPPVSPPTTETGGAATGPGLRPEGSSAGPSQVESPSDSAAPSSGSGGGSDRTDRRRRSSDSQRR